MSKKVQELQILFEPTDECPYVVIGFYCEHYMDFQSYELFPSDGIPTLNRLISEGANYARNTTLRDVWIDSERKINAVRGTIKWDGCCDIEVGNERGYVHLCGMDAVARLFTLFGVLYHLARNIPAWDGD